MRPRKDIINKKFGKLTVLRFNEELSITKTMYDCICECGNHKTVGRNLLVKGKTKSCGCAKGELSFLSRNGGNDTNIGKKYNQLICIERIDEHAKKYDDGKKRNAKYKFVCECGNEKICPLSDVKSGRIKSCGCIRTPNSPHYNNVSFKSLIGQKFFNLTVIQRVENKFNKVYYLCKCDCGNEIIVRGESLKTFHNKSCGCQKKSLGELIISQYLDENNIEYDKEFCFNDLPLLKFDFAIKTKCGKILLIEFDGKQHFEPVAKFGGEKEFLLQQNRDQRKNDYCREKNIPLLRIDYKKILKVKKMIHDFLTISG